MEKSNGNGVSPSNGLKGRPPYSVETPYGFRLDLDFLKYVDDIEKGNTIKRVAIQRRSRAPRASTLPRHLNLSSWGGYRPGPWGSTGALSSARPRPLDARQQGYGSWAFDGGGGGGAGALASPAASRAEMEASIRAFDEQPLGEHIRPHLLRASSLPLTVLLRKGSESTDDAGSLRSSRDRLGGRDASCEDVFDSAGDSPSPAPSGAVGRDFSGTLRRLGEALERVGELEAEVRVVPELRAQIRALREERERLRLGVVGVAPRPAANGAKEPPYATSDLKRPRQEGSDGHAVPRNRGAVAAAEEEEEGGEEHAGGRGWRTSTDLDELLTVTSLQAKVAALEQKLHESVQELQRARALLRDQLDEGRRKDERLAELSGNAGARERAAAAGGAGPDEGCFALGGSNLGGPVSAGAPAAAVDGQRGQPNCSVVMDDKERDDGATTSSVPRTTGRSPQEEPPPGGLDPAHHVGRIRRLLEQQWVLLCAGREREGGGGGAPEHPDPKVTSLQQEMMGLVHTLSRFYSHDEAEGDGLHHGGPKSIMKRNGNVRTSKNLHFAGVNEGCETAWGEAGGDKDSVRGHRGSEQARRAAPGAAVTGRERGVPPPGGAPPSTDRTAGGAGQTERPDTGATAAAAGGPPEEPGGPVSDGNPGREPPGGRGSVSEEFMAACQFLKDHMDNMDNPNDEMRRALVVLFQNWFRVAAEEDSLAGGVSEHLGEVRTATPALLPFLVNLADDNGNTALHYSVSHSNYGIVGLLLQTGVCEVDLQNKAGYTAVMLASLTAPSGPGDTGVVHRLMELADVNARSSQAGQSALLLAVRHGRAPMVRTLLGRGADPNVRDRQGTTALMCASERGHAHIVRLLLDTARCDVGLTDRAGRTALSIAVQGSHSDTAALLQAHVKARGL